MTFAQIEKELKEKGFNHDRGNSPLKGMRYKNGGKYAFVWVEKNGDSIKHKVEYVDEINKLNKLKKELEKVEKQLEKVRGCSPLTDGWQTMRLARKQRSWDILGEKKTQLRWKIDELEQELSEKGIK